MSSTKITGIDLEAGKEKSVQKMFSSIAKYYDINNTILSMGLHHIWKKKAVAELSASRGDTLLDICSGTGDLAYCLADIVKDEGSVVAVDLNLEMMKTGKKKIGKIKNLTFLRSNAEMTGFKDNSFDGATVAFGMRNLSDLHKGFREIHRILKKGGKIICLEFSTPLNPALKLIYDFYSFALLPCVGKLVSNDDTGVYRYLPESIRNFPSQEKLTEIMYDAGFSHVKYKNLSGGIVAIHIGKK